jgi:hypothetical protein
MRYRVAVAFVLAGLSASWGLAQVPAGGEFQVNTYTTDYQAEPLVASSAGGAFVVAWMSTDGNASGVFARRYDAHGTPLGTEFQVNTFTVGTQTIRGLTSDALGGFIVVWQSQDADGAGVFARRYDHSGVPLGAEFQVNTHTTGTQGYARVASAAGGSFVVVWASYSQDGDLSGVFAQRYDASGAPLGTEFRVNTHTTSFQAAPAVASDAGGGYVVTWDSYAQDGSDFGVYAQRYDPAGVARGAEFQVNTFTTGTQWHSSVAADSAGNFVVVWTSYFQDGSYSGVFAQRYDASGTPRGAEFQVNTYTTLYQLAPSVVSDAVGDFVVSWFDYYGQDGSYNGVFAQRYDASGTPRGGEFQVNTYTTDNQDRASVASDAVGNLMVAWRSALQDGSDWGVFAQRYGGIVPAAMAVYAGPFGVSDDNGVFETGESVDVRPSWKNVNGASQTFDAGASSFDGPAATGISYQLQDATGLYGSVADGATAQCSDCYQVQVTSTGARPATHWDATLTEYLTPDSLGQTKLWKLHIGESFTDVPKTSGYYRFVETLLHKGITGGCTTSTYCPTATSGRQQMSIFALVAKEGSGYLPPACGTTPMFSDVPVTSPYCRWVEELSRRGVVSGCGGGKFCPASAVTRGQMPIFVLKTLDPAIDPPACGATPVFGDVPASSPYCKWVEELARRGVVSGCGGGNYCPTSPVNRAQMAVFISATFGLTLYGP